MKSKLLIALILLSACKVNSPPSQLELLDISGYAAFPDSVVLADRTIYRVDSKTAIVVPKALDRKSQDKTRHQYPEPVGTGNIINLKKNRGPIIIGNDNQQQAAPQKDKTRTITKSSDNTGFVWLGLAALVIGAGLLVLKLRKII